MDLTEAEDIKKRWQEYTEELYKKELHSPDNHDGVITHLEPDILEREVAQWCPTLNHHMDCSLPGSSIHGIFTQEYWSGLHFLLQRIFPTHGLNPGLPQKRASRPR